MIITSIILSLLQPSSTNGCADSFAFRYSTCTFRLNYFVQCQQFSFGGCSWEECSGGAADLCSKYPHKNHTSWSLCTEICCDSSVAYPPNPKGLELCQDYLEKQYMMDVLMKIVLPISCVIILIICCCCCKWRHNRSQSFRDSCKRVRYYFYCCVTCLCCRETIHQPHPVVKWDSSPSLEPYDSIIEPVWGTRLILKPGDIYCSVCLEESTSLSLQCGHNYHRQCIIQCLRRKKECVLCRSTQINQITVYCQKCCSSSYQAKLWQSIRFLDNNKQICDLCAYVQERQVDLNLFQQR